MNVLCWNCQGLGNPWTVQGLKGLISLNFPTFIFLCETRCTVAEMTKVRQNIGWRNCFSVSFKLVTKKGDKGVSRSGGIAMLWADDVPISLHSYSDNHIDVLVGEVNDPKRWRFTGIYGFPRVEDRHRTWALIRALSLRCSLPWLLGGDFNEVLAGSEKDGGPPRADRQISEFRGAVDSCCLHDLQFTGPMFTWRGNRWGHEVRVRLDRFLASSSWSDFFPVSRVVHLSPSMSDHLPILIEVRAPRPKKKRKKKRFRFEDYWLMDEECKEVVVVGWNSATGLDPVSVIHNKISNTRDQLMGWSRGRFGNLKQEIEKVRNQLTIFFLFFSLDPTWEEEAGSGV